MSASAPESSCLLAPLRWDVEAGDRTLGMLLAAIRQETSGTEASERLRWMVTNAWQTRLSGHVEDVEGVYCAHLASQDAEDARELGGRIVELHGRLALQALRVEQAGADEIFSRVEAFCDALDTYLEVAREELLPWLSRHADQATLKGLAVRWDGRRTRSGRGSPRESRAIRGEDADLTHSS